MQISCEKQSEIKIEITCIVKGAIILQQNHLAMEIYYLLSNVYHLLTPFFSACYSVTQILQPTQE